MEREEVEVLNSQDAQVLVERLTNYTIFNSLYQNYNNLKEFNTYLKAGLETAENITQPVLKKLDTTLNIDQRGVQLLDKIETTATKVTDFYQSTKDNAVVTGISILSTANRPLNQLLDITEDLVNKILPAENILDEESYSLNSDDDSKKELTEDEKEEEKSQQEPLVAQSPIPRLKELSSDVTRRLQNVAKTKIHNSNSFAYFLDLIQYASEKTKLIADNASQVQVFIEDKKEEATTKLVNPVKEIIEQQTADIKSQSRKAVVAVVSTIAHAAQVVRQQVHNKVPATEVLEENLRNITNRTKEAVMRLNDQELSRYIGKVRESCEVALQTIVEVSSYIPFINQLLPLLSNFQFLPFSGRLALENVEEKKDQRQFD